MPMLPAALPVWRVLSVSGLAATACARLPQERCDRAGPASAAWAMRWRYAARRTRLRARIRSVTLCTVSFSGIGFSPVIASRCPVDGGGVRPVEDQPGRGIGRACSGPCPVKGRAFPRAMDQHEAPARPGQRRRGQGDALLWRTGGVQAQGRSAAFRPKRLVQAVGTGEERGDVQILPPSPARRHRAAGSAASACWSLSATNRAARDGPVKSVPSSRRRFERG